MSKSAQERFDAARDSHQYCGICGHVPKRDSEPPYHVNKAPLRWWDVDDGWKIGALCHGCACGDDVRNGLGSDPALDAKPRERDYAFHNTNTIADVVDTDEDPTEAT